MKKIQVHVAGHDGLWLWSACLTAFPCWLLTATLVYCSNCRCCYPNYQLCCRGWCLLYCLAAVVGDVAASATSPLPPWVCLLVFLSSLQTCISSHPVDCCMIPPLGLIFVLCQEWSRLCLLLIQLCSFDSTFVCSLSWVASNKRQN